MENNDRECTNNVKLYSLLNLQEFFNGIFELLITMERIAASEIYNERERKREIKSNFLRKTNS